MRPKVALALVVLTFLGLALIYAVVVPPLEGFDARAHFKYAAYLHQERRLPVVTPDLVDYSYELVVHPPLYYSAIALATAPLPMDQALTYARASENPYHDKSLTLRQTITLPTVAPGVLATLWVARLISLLGGVVTVVGAYALVRTLLPADPWLAVAVAALTGFNPQFLFTSVTITNDAWVPALLTLTLWLLARATLQEQPVWCAWLLTGLVAGLAAITKYSTPLIAVPGLLLLWRYGRQVGWRPLLAAIGWLIVGGLLTAGFWYGRNLLLYGSPVPFDQMAVALPTMRRSEPMSLAQLIETIPWLFTSYWGVFVSILAPPAYLNVTTWAMLIAAVGLVRNALCIMRKLHERQLRSTQYAVRTTHPTPIFALAFALLWFLAIFAGVLHWTRTVEFGEQGRLIHAAAPAFALLLVTGWRAWLPTRWQRPFVWLLPLLFVGVALWPLPTLVQAYALPEPEPQPVTADRTVLASFAGGMQLLGVDLPEGAALSPGDRLPLTLYFQATQPITDNYTLFLHLADAENNLLYQFDGVPDRGRHPTRQWQPGVAFADQRRLTVSEVATDTLATLSLGFYHYDDPDARQSVVDANGTPLGDRVIVGQIRVTTTPFTPPALAPDPLARWQHDLQLLAADVQQTATGAPAAVTLTWQATNAIQTDYTAFVQVLDQANQVVAQLDRPPLPGQAPTSTWREGEIFTDRFVLDAPPADWQRLIVGFYDASGTRLPLAAGDDAVLLLEKAD
jgi:4-amino-4-deoxy-L-arabinose transferase-like glycosyltransferase